MPKSARRGLGNRLPTVRKCPARARRGPSDCPKVSGEGSATTFRVSESMRRVPGDGFPTVRRCPPKALRPLSACRKLPAECSFLWFVFIAIYLLVYFSETVIPRARNFHSATAIPPALRARSFHSATAIPPALPARSFHSAAAIPPALRARSFHSATAIPHTPGLVSPSSTG